MSKDTNLTSKRRWIALGIVATLIIGYFVFRKGDEKNTILTAKAIQQDLVITVETTGELDALNSVKIKGPDGMRKARIWQAKINRLIEEGTTVKKGDFVAEIDKSSLSDQIKNATDDVTLAESNMIQQKLDTTLTLRQSRDNILNLKYQVEESIIKLEQSAFEPPATIKQAKMNVEKNRRSLKQAKMNYRIKCDQMEAKMKQISTKFSKKRRQLDFLLKLEKEFVIFAPEDGMVVYHKDEWSGQKVKEGSNIHGFNPVVATLPDLSKMVSKTFINEVDIRRIKLKQKVEIGLDAFPEKRYSGVVTKVANVGEQKPNSDAKVFEVEITINESDPIFRPSMTTSNRIITKIVEDQKLIPIEALYTDNDSIFYIYKKQGFGFKKTVVTVGDQNDHDVAILTGIENNDVVSLNRIEE
ncbi:HlyD family efflux transporter periplasmic adaptor subunit [Halosquirtibacter xylanolyticus]|uniref:efflux RND transporter periplasmic adaptor subunit n=1 Tax=Halosquirtibacter xylanolyticus TaxID=3374599 RepID=UPI00374A3122|nr:HlyD family efflux transporter periplasmic adaptor subunit [Prolixibacteraceae bacterium]